MKEINVVVVAIWGTYFILYVCECVHPRQRVAKIERKLTGVDWIASSVVRQFLSRPTILLFVTGVPRLSRIKWLLSNKKMMMMIAAIGKCRQKSGIIRSWQICPIFSLSLPPSPLMWCVWVWGGSAAKKTAADARFHFWVFSWCRCRDG